MNDTLIEKNNINVDRSIEFAHLNSCYALGSDLEGGNQEQPW